MRFEARTPIAIIQANDAIFPLDFEGPVMLKRESRELCKLRLEYFHVRTDQVWIHALGPHYICVDPRRPRRSSGQA